MTTTHVTTLPAEILSLIFGEVSRPTTAISSLPDAAQQLYNANEWADLRALRLTCQRFNGLIEPILFSDVHVNLCGSRLFKTSSQLEAFSLRRTRVTKFVKTLDILSLEQQFYDVGVSFSGHVANMRVF